MPVCCGKTQYSTGFGYQALPPPCKAARAARRTSAVRMLKLPWWGTDGMPVIPRLGEEYKGLRRIGQMMLSGRIGGIHLYVAAVVTAAAAVGVGLVVAGVGIGNAWTVAALALVAAGAERGSVKFASSSTEQSISLLPTLFAGVLFGP